MTIYLDTSALVPIHIDEPNSSLISDVLGTLSTLPSLSDYGVGEFGSVISRYVRMSLIPPAAGTKILQSFDEWLVTSADLIQVTTQDIVRASAIVRQFDLKLRFPDALHIAICANRALTLATCDQQMTEAATALRLQVLIWSEHGRLER